MGNGIGNELGETVAAGLCDGATPPVLSNSFGVSSVARSAKGTYTVTLFNQIDPRTCEIEATSVVAGQTAVSDAGPDTVSVKNFVVSDAAGAPIDGGFFFSVKRTKYTP